MLVSIVIPVGNLSYDEANLLKILSSVPKDDIEVVAVLDTDEEFAEEKFREMLKKQDIKNFLILNSTSRTPGGSRNLGKNSSTGDWILFCDADDMPNFQGILKAARQASSETQIVISSFSVLNSDYAESKMPISQSTSIALRQLAHSPGVWRWLFRSNLIRGVHFPALSMGEDQYFLLQVMNTNPNFRLSKDSIYTYCSEIGHSLTNSKKKIEDLKQVLKLELGLKIETDTARIFRNYLVFKQIITLIKFGMPRTKLIAISRGAVLFISISLSDKLGVIRFLLTRKLGKKYD
jgi:glycosyltransferase involved in cell wall biosynthesis